MERDGVAVPYRGLAAKRGAPTQADYMELESGAKSSVLIPLDSAYDFDPAGRYSVRYLTFNPEPKTQQLVEVSSKTSLGVLSEFCAKQSTTKQSTAKPSTCPQLVVASERLAELAREQGFVQIEIADSAEVEAMARAVKRILGEGRE